MSRAAFYCDESGYTGVNWGDPNQPVFVHGGWMVPCAHHDSLLTALSQFRERHRLSAAELKWQRVARRPAGSEIFRDVFHVMLTEAAIPFFLVMDKGYAIAAKAVETLFDPAYNPSLPVTFTSAFDIKKELAECLLLAPDLLTEFADLLRAGIEPPPAILEQYASRVADFLTANRAPDLGKILRHFEQEGLVDMAGEFGTDVWMRTTTGHSMFALMNQLEQFLRPRDVDLTIVHDNIVRFDNLLALVRSTFRDSDGSDAVVINGEPRFARMPTVKGLRLADSKDEPLIQLADLLCGFVRTVFTKLKREQELDQNELAVVGDLVMLRHKFNSWDVNVPAAIFERTQALGWSDLKRRFLAG